MSEMSGAQALVRSLAREGVEVVFTLPGVQIMDAFDAFYDEPGIRLVLVRPRAVGHLHGRRVRQDYRQARSRPGSPRPRGPQHPQPAWGLLTPHRLLYC